MFALFCAPVAGAHLASSSLNQPVPGSAALRASTRIQLEQLPRENGGRCVTTKAVPGLGNACATSGGLFRLKLRDGSSLTTHGFDGPQPDSFNSYLTGSTQALSTASVDNIQCVDPATTKHTTLIYAYPPGQSSRFGEIAPLMRQEAYRMSAFLDAESRSVNPLMGLRIPFECDGSGTPMVREAQTTTPTSSANFGNIVTDLQHAGYGTSASLLDKDRYVVFYDASLGNGLAGTGHLYSDDSPSTSSSNNFGGMFAVEFNWANVPHWDVMLHEAGHNMGAVQSSAPNTSGTYTSGGYTYSAGHCSDGQDIMCYSDGGSNTYNPNVCAVEQFDCNRDDYFNPSPAVGSYLATHWNTAALYNQYLVHVNLVDRTAPTTPTNLIQGGASNTAASLSWAAATDNVAVAGYHVWIDNGAGGWTLKGTTAYTQTHFTIGGLSASNSYAVAVSTFDGSNNESTLAPLTIVTNSTPDTVAPFPASLLSAAAVTMTSARLTWAPASDNVGVVGYIVYRDLGNGNTTQLATTITNSFNVTGLMAASTYALGVAAFDDAGHQSGVVWITVKTSASTATTSADTQAPTAPGRPRVVSRARKSVTLAWGAAADNVGVSKYLVYRWNGSRWALVKSPAGSARKVIIGGLRPRHRYVFILRARDAGGNFSGWSRQAAATTKR